MNHSPAQYVNRTKQATTPRTPVNFKPMWSTIFHNTSDSSAQRKKDIKKDIECVW